MDTSGDVCHHLEINYPTVVGHQPFMYWVICKEDLDECFGPEGFCLALTESESGDKCHMVITGLTDDQGREFVRKKMKPPYIYLCINNECRQLSPEEIRTLAEKLS